VRVLLAAVLALGPALGVLAACGETRRPIGDECLRSDDCLSGVCAARSCVAAPPLVVGAGAPPPDEIPRLPTADGGADAADAARDASEGG
jgi:hypothetical protein